MDLLPEEFGDIVVRAAADDHGHGWVAIPAALLPPEGLIPEQDRGRYVARLRDQPVATFTDPIHLTGAVDRVALRPSSAAQPATSTSAAIRLKRWLSGPVLKAARPYRELSAPHDPHLFDPAGTAAVLHELAATASTEAGGSTVITQE